jgi:hypothetical protein
MNLEALIWVLLTFFAQYGIYLLIPLVLLVIVYIFLFKPESSEATSSYKVIQPIKRYVGKIFREPDGSYTGQLFEEGSDESLLTVKDKDINRVRAWLKLAKEFRK